MYIPTYIRNHVHFYLEKFGLFRSMCVAVLSLRECSKGGEYVQGGVVVRGAGGGGDVVAAGGGVHGQLLAPRGDGTTACPSAVWSATAVRLQQSLSHPRLVYRSFSTSAYLLTYTQPL